MAEHFFLKEVEATGTAPPYPIKLLHDDTAGEEKECVQGI